MEKKSFKITGYDPIAQEALNEIRSELSLNKVYQVVIDNSCGSNVGGYVTTGDIHTIHLCVGNIKRSLGKAIKDTNSLKAAIKSEIKNVIMKHEMVHVKDLSDLSDKDKINRVKYMKPVLEQKAKKKEDWKELEEMSLRRKVCGSSIINTIFLYKNYEEFTLEKSASPYYKSINNNITGDFYLELMSPDDVSALIDDFIDGETIELIDNVRNIKDGTRKVNKDSIRITFPYVSIDKLKGKGSKNPILRYDRINKKVEYIPKINPLELKEKELITKLAVAEYSQRNFGDIVLGSFYVGNIKYDYSIGGSDFGMPEIFFKSSENNEEPTDEITGKTGIGAVKVFKTILDIVKNWAAKYNPPKFFMSSKEPRRTQFYDKIIDVISKNTGYNYDPVESQELKMKHSQLGVPIDKLWVFKK